MTAAFDPTSLTPPPPAAPVDPPPPPFQAEPHRLGSYRGVLSTHATWLLGALAVSDDLASPTVEQAK